MTKLNWSKAHRSQRSWAYTAGQPALQSRKPTRNDWIRAQLMRKLSDASHRVAMGKTWMQTIPHSDPRYPRWLARLNQLKAQQKALRDRINAL